jgi:hypothetical protein
MHQFLRRDISPGKADVALVFERVIDDRLAPFVAPGGGALHVPVLNANVIDPGLAMIEIHRLFAVVDRLVMPRRIVFLNDDEEAIPPGDWLPIVEKSYSFASDHHTLR